ncbi:hypothetical protein GGI25_002171 [Coemansia spiralis]|uniref:Transcription initiation factor TFIID subunit 1 histone acetyltransferase domain-containing protein n=2 Tax=Coemansia TaxID=4863 RepID=A0A9W8GB21_9FUNG|nr:hypothetical protein BX070DRAFT_221793 [Coemansia spiralis]KAJ1996180.1 hypothetical protein EDC05_000070 [Coemansia umbellata]KAJ2626063.1 hypothetical protein GGI26_000147 [Coemansia sp. RSA 1358]KAJ2678583.1 hypothetical protein GGI25_002171 [Coemansia spiralis]
MSLTGFIFGNVDEEGNLSDNELNDELRETLGGEEAGDYLSGILGSSLFSDALDSSSRQKRKRSREEATDTEEDHDEVEAETTAASANASSAIQPVKDAIDFSDFNELAEDAAVPVKWKNTLSSSAALKYGSSITRAQVDDDYDSEDGDEGSKQTMSNELPAPGVKPSHLAAGADVGIPSVDSGSVLAIMTDDGTDNVDVDNNDLLMGSDEEILEDLFDSTAKPTTPDAAAVDGSSTRFNHIDHLSQPSASSTAQGESRAADFAVPSEESPESTSLQPWKNDDSQAVVPRAVKKIPPGIIRFTDYFGCHLIHQPKKPRRNRPRETEDGQEQQLHDLQDSQQRLALAQPSLDTRKLLSGTQTITKPDRFLKELLSQSIAADSKSDLYITIDAGTGATTSQKMEPKKRMVPSSDLFDKMPYPLDIEDWEEQVIWNDNDSNLDKVASKSSEFDDSRIENDEDESGALKLIAHSRNSLLEDFESHIIWDPDTPFQPCTQLQINMNDMHMLFEDVNSIKESHAREAERQRLLDGVDRFNLSNDHFYEALQEGKVHRVRQTFGQLIIAHSLPSLRLQPPYFKMRHTRNELKSWHRPFMQAPVNTPIQFSRVRTAKKRKQKHSMENPWASKDITLKDSADCILIEYSEEYPFVLSNVGMGSVFVNYYRKRGMQDQSFPKVDLGELFILDVADISPFLNFGNIEPGQVVPALYNNMFRAPLFQQKLRKTDFLVVKHVSKGESKWYVRGFKHHYVVGQTYPLQEVPAPHSRKVTTTIKHRLQVAAYRLMNRNQYHLLQMGKLSRLFPEYSELQIRQRLKEFCEYQRKGLGAGYWRPKHNMPIPDEENLRKMLTPEMLCLFESMRVCQQQLHDAGKLGEEDEDDGDDPGDSKLSIEEILATWNLTRNFINATQGKAMLQLYGEADPTGIGEGFSFVRVSMKDIFLRAGESVEEKLAEIEARPKSAHRYNVAEQQQIYKDEISCIWNKQFKSLTRSEPVRKERSEAHSDENIIVPEVNDMFGDSATGNGVSAIIPARMVPGSAMDASHKMARGSLSEQQKQQQQSITAHANFIQPNRKGLIIRRAVKSPYTGELMWRTEVVKDLAVIQAYLRQRRIIENLAHEQDNLFDDDALYDNEASSIDMVGETQRHLAQLKLARERRHVEAQVHEKSHMTTFSLPQPNKPKKEVVRRCGNCGQLGHMKTNKRCPRYYDFNPA